MESNSPRHHVTVYALFKVVLAMVDSRGRDQNSCFSRFNSEPQDAPTCQDRFPPGGACGTPISASKHALGNWAWIVRSPPIILLNPINGYSISFHFLWQPLNTTYDTNPFVVCQVTLAGSFTASSTASSRMGRCPRTRPSAAAMTLSTRSSRRRVSDGCAPIKTSLPFFFKSGCRLCNGFFIFSDY